MQIKTAMKYHLIPVGWPILIKQEIRVSEDVQKREPCEMLAGIWIGVATIEKSMTYGSSSRN